MAIGEEDEGSELDAREAAIERRARELRTSFNVTGHPASSCNAVLSTYGLKSGNLLILKCGEEFFIRREKVIVVMIQAGLLDNYRPEHISNLSYEVNPSQIFWKLPNTETGYEFFALYLGNRVTMRYAKSEDLAVFVAKDIPARAPGWARNIVDFDMEGGVEVISREQGGATAAMPPRGQRAVRVVELSPEGGQSPDHSGMVSSPPGRGWSPPSPEYPTSSESWRQSSPERRGSWAQRCPSPPSPPALGCRSVRRI